MDKPKIPNPKVEPDGSSLFDSSYSEPNAAAHRRAAFLLCRALTLGLLAEHYPDSLGLHGEVLSNEKTRHVCNLLLKMTNPAIFHAAGSVSIVDAALALYRFRVGV